MALSFVVLFFAVGGQTSWILRPYLVRPRTEAPPFLRAREGGFADAVVQSIRSAVGIYDEADVREGNGPSFRARGEIDTGEEQLLEDLREKNRRAPDEGLQRKEEAP